MAKSKGRHNSNRISSGSTPEAASSGANSKKRVPDTSSIAIQDNVTNTATGKDSVSSKKVQNNPTIWQFFYEERFGIAWVVGCALIGWLFGFGIGTGHLTGGRAEISPWRVTLGAKIRATHAYQLFTLQVKLFPSSIDGNLNLANDPSHPNVFSILREAIVREKGGYVHPDLGILVPAPSGAARGLGMVRSSYHHCQSRCMPGFWKEKLDSNTDNQSYVGANEQPIYNQEEVLLRIPLSFQITRSVAIVTLTPLIPKEVRRNYPLYKLDDAALFVMFLAHERGLSRASRWLPYIASLPMVPSCGYSMENRPYMLDAIEAMREELGLDVNGWRGALHQAGLYADRIANSLAQDYGVYLQSPEGISIVDNLKWALCHVASRATAGSEKHGSLRLVPMLDLINHDAGAGGFSELTGKEKMSHSDDFVDSTEEDSGTFVVRSIRHGRRKPLKQGQVGFVSVGCILPHHSPITH